MGQLVVQKGYSSLTLPNSLLEQIDHFLQDNSWGYATRPEVVKQAVREFLLRHQINREAEQEIRQMLDAEKRGKA